MDKIYICSRFRADAPEERARNLKVAMWACRKATDTGFKPVCPHLFYPQFLDDEDPEDRGTGMKMAQDDLKYCKEVWVIEDGFSNSDGMRDEIKFAKKLGKFIKHVRTPEYAENLIVSKQKGS